MTNFILTQAVKYLLLITTSDKFVRVFTLEERNHIQQAYKAIESALHYPE